MFLEILIVYSIFGRDHFFLVLGDLVHAGTCMSHMMLGARLLGNERAHIKSAVILASSELEKLVYLLVF
jgi:hypothetical protein